MRERLASWSGGRRCGPWVLLSASSRPVRLFAGLLGAVIAGVVLLAIVGVALRALRLHGEAVGIAEMPLTAVAIAAAIAALGVITWAILDTCAVAAAALAGRANAH